MAHITAKDPFGFVGSHVIRQPSNSYNSYSSRPTAQLSRIALAFATSSDGGASDSAHAVHGWITRYNAQLDAYTLFIPGKGASVHSRTDVLKLAADQRFVVQLDGDDDHNDDAAAVAPTEDTTSRYVGVPVTKPSDGSTRTKEVYGRVQCYLPFADTFRVAFDDGTRVDVTEDALIDNMIRMLTAAASAPGVHMAQPPPSIPTATTSSRKRKRNGSESPPVESTSSVTVSVPPPLVSMMPVSYAAALGIDSSPVVTPSNILELVAARDSCSSDGSNDAVTLPLLPPAMMTAPQATMTTAGPSLPFVKPEPEPFAKPEPLRLPTPLPINPTNIVTLIDDDDDADVAMVPLDLDDAVLVPVVSACDGNDPWAAAPSRAPAPPFYVVSPNNSWSSEPVAPLESRNAAFKVVREALVELLDRPEATAKKLAIQYDILQNLDIKPISSIKRFAEASGLVVLNHLIATYLSAPDAAARAANVLHLLKIVAMLPIPARKLVVDSKIALTIGTLAKPRSREAFPALPTAAMHLAKWIKRKWTEHFRKLEEQEERTGGPKRTVTPTPTPPPARAGHPSQRLGTRTGPSGAAATAAAHRVSRLVDMTPIPRLANRPVLTDANSSASSSASESAAHARPTTAGAATASASMNLPLSAGSSAGSSRKSSLKPDWLRQQETLRRTRFTSESGRQDSAAEYNHYRRNQQQHQQQSGNATHRATTATPAAHSSSRSSDAVAALVGPHENEQHESAGGVRGTFGRPQKLAFSARWSVTEFYRDAPPSAVRFSAGTRAHSAHSARRPRSILRRESKYQSSLDTFH